MRMKLMFSMAIVVFLLAGISAVFGQQDDVATIPRIPLNDFKELVKSGKAVIVDVRSLDSYKAGHIPGSISIPLSDIQTRFKELPTDKAIITYCA